MFCGLAWCTPSISVRNFVVPLFEGPMYYSSGLWVLWSQVLPVNLIVRTSGPFFWH
jgi:hypothetical protein